MTDTQLTTANIKYAVENGLIEVDEAIERLLEEIERGEGV